MLGILDSYSGWGSAASTGGIRLSYRGFLDGACD